MSLLIDREPGKDDRVARESDRAQFQDGLNDWNGQEITNTEIPEHLAQKHPHVEVEPLREIPKRQPNFTSE